MFAFEEAAARDDISKQFRNITEDLQPEPAFRCPCCRFKTLRGRGQDEICPVCFWEDDGQDDHDANEVRGGPNGTLSLSKARDNFAEFRVSLASERSVVTVCMGSRRDSEYSASILDRLE